MYYIFKIYIRNIMCGPSLSIYTLEIYILMQIRINTDSLLKYFKDDIHITKLAFILNT